MSDHIEYNKTNIVTLVEKVLNDMDLQTLMGIAANECINNYTTNKEQFYDDWEVYFPNPEPLQ